MQSSCKVTFGTFKNEELHVSYSHNQLIFLTRPMWAAALLGVLGQKLVPPTREVLRIPASNIQSLVLSNIEQSRSMYELVMKDGEVCKITFKKGDQVAAMLTDELKDKFRLNQ